MPVACAPPAAPASTEGFPMALGSLELATWHLFGLSMISLQALTACAHQSPLPSSSCHYY